MDRKGGDIREIRTRFVQEVSVQPKHQRIFQDRMSREY